MEDFGAGRSLIEHGIRSIEFHSTAFFSRTLKALSTLLTVFGAFLPPATLEALNVLVHDRVESLVTQGLG